MIRQVFVTIPACNEQDGIGASLRSVERACDVLHHHTGVPSRIVVTLDSCTDGTASAVAGFPAVEAVGIRARCVGRARYRAAEHALATTDLPLDDVWIASTDADCAVPADWLTRMTARADAGADLVLGTVLPAPGLQNAVHDAWLARHDHRDGHLHVHGANLGIRAGPYLALGGWPGLALHEDVELVTRAVADGRYVIDRSGDAPVVTSCRLSGRVEDGFAAYLRGLAPLMTPAVAPVVAVQSEDGTLLPRRCG